MNTPRFGSNGSLCIQDPLALPYVPLWLFFCIFYNNPYTKLVM